MSALPTRPNTNTAWAKAALAWMQVVVGDKTIALSASENNVLLFGGLHQSSGDNKGGGHCGKQKMWWRGGGLWQHQSELRK
jgi:hypothetical protein